MATETIVALPTHSSDTTLEEDSIEVMTQAEGLDLIDRQAQKYLGTSGEEFMRRYRAGEIAHPHRLEVVQVAMLLPLAEL